MIWAVRLAPYVAIALAVWWVMDLQDKNEALTAENSRMERELDVAEARATQAREAQAVARAETERFRRAAEEYDQIRETILRGKDDAPIPDFLCAYLERLLGPGSCHRDENSGAGGLEGSPNAVPGE